MFSNEKLQYIQCRCMDSDCYKQLLFYNINSSLKRPWLYSNISNITKNIAIEMDEFIDKLIKRNIILNKNRNNNCQIIRQDKIRTNWQELVFSSFICNNFFHSLCNMSNMTIHYKKKSNVWAKYGLPTLYCKKCNVFYNLKNSVIALKKL